ncbi:43165_t:CDS:2 [Gigaspora margarita]|uniref:43165_t:CDS:1 n=1 Tax=Gigaspora margarita TaxID=4874 RepID=A0ABN7V0K5_GIGMA|nr:43165_t:CDS:2 [Gigaspora margarita]
MPLHVALLVAVTSVKNNRLFSHGLAKYKFSKEISQTVRWKYFFPTNEQLQQFTPSDLVFISGKYVVENLEQCITISYASIINSKNPNCEFDISDVPEHANHKLKEVEDYVHFGVESIEYNSVTIGKHVFRVGLFKFLKSGQIIIEATDIDYLRTSTLNYNTFKNSLINSRNRSIIDIVADDIESISAQILLKHAGSSASSNKPGNIGAFESTENLVDASVKTGSCSKENEKKSHQPNYIELDDQDDENNGPDFENEDELDDDTHIKDEECKEDL